MDGRFYDPGETKPGHGIDVLSYGFRCRSSDCLLASERLTAFTFQVQALIECFAARLGGKSAKAPPRFIVVVTPGLAPDVRHLGWNRHDLRSEARWRTYAFGETVGLFFCVWSSGGHLPALTHRVRVGMKEQKIFITELHINPLSRALLGTPSPHAHCWKSRPEPMETNTVYYFLLWNLIIPEEFQQETSGFTRCLNGKKIKK